uniref:Glyco_18 domain-containing protein n=1 Tax=Strongyloides venezuelensis TaxID=75913 RepID=A0A0K0FIQ3_STRVS
MNGTYARKLTHIIYVSINLNKNGTLYVGNYQDKTFDKLAKDKLNHLLSMRKVNPKVKIMFAISKPEQALDFIDLISTNEGRAILISEIIKMIELYSFDGVDLGWERPQVSSVAEVLPEGISNYLMLIREMRKAFNDFEGKKKRNGKLIISFASPESEQLSKSEINLHNISVNVDFINVIDYYYFLPLKFNEDVLSATPAPLSSGPLETIPEITMETDLKLKYYYRNSIDFEKLHMVIPFTRKTLENISTNITEMGKKLDIRKEWPGDLSKSTYRVKSSSIASPSFPTNNVFNIVVNKIKVNNTWFNIPSNSQDGNDFQVITREDQFKLTNITVSIPSDSQNNNEIIIIFMGHKNTHNNIPKGAQNGAGINLMIKGKKVEHNKYYWDRKIYNLKESSKRKPNNEPKNPHQHGNEYKNDRSFQCKKSQKDKCKCTDIQTFTMTYKYKHIYHSEKLKNGRKFNVSETSDNVSPNSQNNGELQIIVNESILNIDDIVVFVPPNILNNNKNDNMEKKANKIKISLVAQLKNVTNVNYPNYNIHNPSYFDSNFFYLEEFIRNVMLELKQKGIEIKFSNSNTCSDFNINEYVCNQVISYTLTSQNESCSNGFFNEFISFSSVNMYNPFLNSLPNRDVINVPTYPKTPSTSKPSFFKQEKVISASDTLTALHIKGNKRTDLPDIFTNPNSIEETMSYVGKKNLGGLIILGVEEDDNNLLLDTINASDLCN